MRFRPCIDIHNGAVKQIVGGSLNDSGASENFVASRDADYYASLYSEYNLRGGHIIILNKQGTDEYEASLSQAKLALKTYPGGMQIGGGITDKNAKDFIDAGASHIIVTSYIFTDGRIDYSKIDALIAAVGKEHIVIDLSCRKNNGSYHVVTDRWQTFTDVVVSLETLKELADYCDEFLIHGVDVEGMKQGIDTELLELLARTDDVSITYAGGVKNMSDVDTIEKIGKGKIDYTVGSALDLFGGDLSFRMLAER